MRKPTTFTKKTHRQRARQYRNYCETKKFDTSESNRLTDYLCKIGIDELLADDLVNTIIGDYDEQRLETNLRMSLGENWKEKIAAVEQMINSYLQ